MTEPNRQIHPLPPVLAAHPGKLLFCGNPSANVDCYVCTHGNGALIVVHGPTDSDVIVLPSECIHVAFLLASACVGHDAFKGATQSQWESFAA